MDWPAHNITQPADFWTLWDANQELFAAVSLSDGAERSGAAALTLLFWDILTTLDEEVNLVWPCVSHNFRVIPCVPWLIFEIMSTFLVELATEVIIILRVYAVYSARQRIMRIMQLGFALQAAIMAVSLGVSMPKLASGFYCKAADLPPQMVLYSSASIIFETFLFGLMIVGVIKGGNDGFANTTLMQVVVRDGILAFIGINAVVMLLNTVLFTMAPTTLVTLGFPWLLAILGAAGSRLVLNIRATHAHKVTTPSTLTDIRFSLPSLPSTRHTYSAVHFDDSDRALMPINEEDDDDNDTSTEDTESDREDSALNPSRSQTMSSGGSRRSTRYLAVHPRELSDIESATPPSPLSPETRIP
ncbi:hypothetical protein C8Q80DRAFT_1330316 [Daedaleopsis nitida]|nr:hypothetical protein C8Q80DRAFT_1330316 [Daedaleopsis nitida]